MKKLLIGVSLGLALTVGPVLAQDCKPSKYGPEDEIGTANLVTPARVLAASKLAADPKAWVSWEPGLDNAAAVYLAGLNPVAVGADTWGVEVVPPKQGDKIFYGHVTLLKENGIYILETMNTEPLVAQGVNEFMFVLGQARIKGAVQMIINPVALW